MKSVSNIALPLKLFKLPASREQIPRFPVCSLQTFRHFGFASGFGFRISGFTLHRAVLLAVTSMLLAGCLFKPATVSPRHFVLAPIPANEPAPASAEHLSVGIRFVKMPSYLLRDSIAIRTNANEIGYLDNAQWGERLDQCFQRALTANLSRLLSSDSIYAGDWGGDRVMVRVSVNVQQFDVDTQGRGTLIAQWRISAPDSETPLKRGRAQLARNGSPPHGNPAVIVTTLSDVTADFSREIAQSIRDSVNSSQQLSAAGK
jgi:uncharacterized lipoprotein YmbA